MDGNGASTTGDKNSSFGNLAKMFQANRTIKQEHTSPSSVSASSNYTKRQGPNNVWAEVAQAENIQSTMEQFEIVSVVDNFKILRGPETYVVGEKRKRPSTATISNTRSANKRKKDDGNIDEEDDDTDYESDSSISSGGLSDDTKQDLTRRSEAKKSAFREFKNQKAIPKCKVKKESTRELNLSESSSDEEQPTNKAQDSSEASKLKSKTGRKRTSRQIMEEQIAELEDWKVAHFIANRLKETKKKLLINTIKLLEREATLKLFWKTLKIERLGGLMIKNQSRRRTPGGVFLYLLRTDKRFDQAKIREIFKEERTAKKAEKKVTRLEKDKKYFSHIQRMMNKNKQNAAPYKRELDTDSEEEELEDSYQLPSCAVGSLQGYTGSASSASSSYTKPPITQSTQQSAPNTQPLRSVPVSTKQELISYDDDFLDINCNVDEFL